MLHVLVIEFYQCKHWICCEGCLNRVDVFVQGGMVCGGHQSTDIDDARCDHRIESTQPGDICSD